MRVSAVASILLATVGSASANPLLQDRAVCNADNCARAVTGTRAGLATTRLADCSSFQQLTVSPATQTVTSTIYGTTVVVTSTYGVGDSEPTTVTTLTQAGTVIIRRSTTFPYSGTNYVKRTAAVTGDVTYRPTSIPSYATGACSVASRYGSACACAGVGETTTYLPAPTSYSYVTQPATTETTYVPVVTKTYYYNVSAYDTTAVATATATGLPCNALVKPKVGYEDSFRVRCNVSPSRGGRFISVIGSTNATSEYDCLVDCAKDNSCSYAEYVFNPPVNCILFRGDSANPGLYYNPNTDVLQREIRGTGTGGVFPTGTMPAKRRDLRPY